MSKDVVAAIFVLLFTSISFSSLGVFVGSCNSSTQHRKDLVEEAIEADEAHYCVESHEWKFQWEDCDG